MERFHPFGFATVDRLSRKHINDKRARHKPGKAAKTFGKITGYSAAKKALHKYQDRKRRKRHLKNKAQLREAQSASLVLNGSFGEKSGHWGPQSGLIRADFM